MIPGNANPLLLASAAADAAAAGPTRSLRFNDGDSAYLSRTPSSAGNQKTWTISFWVKRVKSGAYNPMIDARSPQNDSLVSLLFNSSDQFELGHYSFSSIKTSRVYRDFSSWYHIVLAVDTTQATASDRIKVYTNGVEETSFATSTYPAQNTTYNWNTASLHTINQAGSFYGGQYLADIYAIDGSQLEPTSFGAYDDNGVWQAAAYSGTFGTNGFHLLDFANESTVGHDSSGNENDFTANNISTSAGAGNDVLFDVPTNGDQTDTGAGGEISGNYCVINPLSIPSQSVTLSNGNLDHTGAGTNVARVGTIAIPSSGKWYWEITCNSGGSGAWLLGINGDTNSQALRLAYVSDARKYTDAGGGFSSYGASFTSGDVIGVAVDMDADTLTFYKNGSTQGTAFTSISSGYTNIFPYFQTEHSGRGLSVNFGQRAWAYSAPSNHKALCTTNLPTPTIADGSTVMDIVLYAGNNDSPRDISGLSFQPDWVWIKSRTSGAAHAVGDSVRGANKNLLPNETSDEATGLITGFNSDGFEINRLYDGATNGTVNGSGHNFVAWCWDAGTSTVSNTDGSITSSVRASATSGFSIVSYTGNGSSSATVGHLLGVAPEMVIIKGRETTNGWSVYHKSLTSNYVVQLNSTSAQFANSATSGGGTGTPTSSVLTFDSGTSNVDNVNKSSNDFIAYCFASVAGFSQISSWEGNGSTDGPFVHTGFRPAFILYKASDAAEHWHIRDTAREPHNVTQNRLLPSSNIAEGGDADFNIDILSNGFKLRASNATQNQNGTTYIYYAVAENPFQANGGLAR